jgi:argininosuccinate lyase
MSGAQFNAERMAQRAAEGSITVTELADTIARERGLPFRSAHAIASQFVQARAANPTASAADALGVASTTVLGQALDYSPARLEEILSARNFVEVRTTFGGPAPTETGDALGVSGAKLGEDRAWLEGRLARLTAAESELRTRAAAL